MRYGIGTITAMGNEKFKMTNKITYFFNFLFNIIYLKPLAKEIFSFLSAFVLTSSILKNISVIIENKNEIPLNKTKVLISINAYISPPKNGPAILLPELIIDDKELAFISQSFSNI